MEKQLEFGFSLIELLVVLVIIGILGAIAVPSYQNYQISSARAAAQTELLQMAALQEKIYLNSSSYTTSVSTAYNGTSGGGLNKTTSNTADGKYTLSCNSCTAQTFELRAVPTAGTNQAGNGCLLIRENGLRQWHEGNDSCTAASPIAW